MKIKYKIKPLPKIQWLKNPGPNYAGLSEDNLEEIKTQYISQKEYGGTDHHPHIDSIYIILKEVKISCISTFLYIIEDDTYFYVIEKIKIDNQYYKYIP